MPQTSHMFPHTYSASYPNASNLPENLHFIGASSRGTPSPNASGLAMGAADAQNGSQEETIDIDDDDTLEPTRTDKRLNWSHEEDVRLVSYFFPLCWYLFLYACHHLVYILTNLL